MHLSVSVINYDEILCVDDGFSGFDFFSIFLKNGIFHYGVVLIIHYPDDDLFTLGLDSAQYTRIYFPVSDCSHLYGQIVSLSLHRVLVGTRLSLMIFP